MLVLKLRANTGGLVGRLCECLSLSLSFYLSLKPELLLRFDLAKCRLCLYRCLCCCLCRCRCSWSTDRRVIPFINKTLILLHIRVDTVSSQRISKHCWTMKAFPNGCGFVHFEYPCQVLTSDYHRLQNGSISSHRPLLTLRLMAAS